MKQRGENFKKGKDRADRSLLGSIMITRDDHHGYVLIHYSQDLSYGEIDDSIGRSDRVEKITGMQYKLWRKRDNLIDCRGERAADILFSLIVSGGRKPSRESCCSQMTVGYVNEAHFIELLGEKIQTGLSSPSLPPLAGFST